MSQLGLLGPARSLLRFHHSVLAVHIANKLAFVAMTTLAFPHCQSSVGEAGMSLQHHLEEVFCCHWLLLEGVKVKVFDETLIVRGQASADLHNDPYLCTENGQLGGDLFKALGKVSMSHHLNSAARSLT